MSITQKAWHRAIVLAFLIKHPNGETLQSMGAALCLDHTNLHIALRSLRLMHVVQADPQAHRRATEWRPTQAVTIAMGASHAVR